MDNHRNTKIKITQNISPNFKINLNKKPLNKLNYSTSTNPLNKFNKFITPLPKTVKVESGNESKFLTFDLESIGFNKIQVPIAISITYSDNKKAKEKLFSNLIIKEGDLINLKLWRDFKNFLSKFGCEAGRYKYNFCT